MPATPELDAAASGSSPHSAHMRTHTQPQLTDTPAPPQCPLSGSYGLRLLCRTRDFGCSGEAFEVWESAGNHFCFTWPAPPPEVMPRYYDMPAYLSHNSEQKGLFAAVYRRVRTFMNRRKLRLIASYVPLRKARVLDFGCGTGDFAGFLAKARPGWSVAGIEPGESAAQQARERHGLAVSESFGALPATERFSLVTAWHALEHVPDPAETLREMNLRLVHHGKLVIALPNYTSYDAEFYGSSWAGLDTPRHLFHYSPKGIAKLAASCGFRLEEKQGMPFDAFYVSLLSEQYRKSGFAGFFRAALIGLLSNIYGASNVNRSSSVIYVFTKTEEAS